MRKSRSVLLCTPSSPKSGSLLECQLSGVRESSFHYIRAKEPVPHAVIIDLSHCCQFQVKSLYTSYSLAYNLYSLHVDGHSSPALPGSDPRLMPSSLCASCLSSIESSVNLCTSHILTSNLPLIQSTVSHYRRLSVQLEFHHLLFRSSPEHHFKSPCQWPAI